jgi:hypothetical protein
VKSDRFSEPAFDYCVLKSLVPGVCFGKLQGGAKDWLLATMRGNPRLGIG